MKFYQILTYAGALPFLLAVILSSSNPEFEIFSLNISEFIKSYTVIIATFMAGSYWGFAFSNQENPNLALVGVSNILALLVCAAFLTLSEQNFFIAMMVYFAGILMVDRYALSKALITHDYWKMRVVVTILVVGSLSKILF